MYGGVTSGTPHFPRVQPIGMHICHGLNIVHIFQQTINENILINISETICIHFPLFVIHLWTTLNHIELNGFLAFGQIPCLRLSKPYILGCFTITCVVIYLYKHHRRKISQYLKIKTQNRKIDANNCTEWSCTEKSYEARTTCTEGVMQGNMPVFCHIRLMSQHFINTRCICLDSWIWKCIWSINELHAFAKYAKISCKWFQLDSRLFSLSCELSHRLSDVRWKCTWSPFHEFSILMLMRWEFRYTLDSFR